MQKIRLLATLIGTGYFCATAYHLFMAYYFNLRYPYNTFLFNPNDRFMDFINPLLGSFDRDPYNPERIHFIGGYLPFGYFVTYLFSLIRPWSISLALFLSGFLVHLNYYISKALFGNNKQVLTVRLLIFIFPILTYPILFAVDRANFDIVIFFFVSIFVLLYQNGKHTLAVLMLAIPIAMKGYPLVLLVLPLLDRRIRDIFFCGMSVILFEVTSLALFKDGLVKEFGKMLVSFSHAYNIAFDFGSLIRFNSSIYTFLLFIFQPINPFLASNTFFKWGYIIIAVVVFGSIILIMYYKNYPFWRRLLIVTLMMILFPQSSADYRLIMLYLPLISFLALDEASNFDTIFIILFGLILIPKAYVVLEADVNIGILLNPILLVLLLGVSMMPIKISE